MNRYRMGLTVKELIALDAAGKLKRANLARTRKFAKGAAALAFRGNFSHPPNVVNRIDKVSEEGVTTVHVFSHRRSRGQRVKA